MLTVDPSQPDMHSVVTFVPAQPLAHSVGAAPIVAHANWVTARDAVLAGIKSRSFVLLIGPAGVGKTSLLQSVSAALDEDGHPAARLRPGDKLPGRTVTVLMDDADLLEAEEFQALGRRATASVLAGLPCTADRLAGWRRQAVIVDLLPVEDTGAFLHELLRHDPHAKPFAPAAVTALARAAGGLPGRIQEIARLAIFLAGMEAASFVQPAHVEQASGVGEEVDPRRLHDDEPVQLLEHEGGELEAPEPQLQAPAPNRGRPVLAAVCWIAAALIAGGSYAWHEARVRVPEHEIWGSATLVGEPARLAPTPAATAQPAPTPLPASLAGPLPAAQSASQSAPQSSSQPAPARPLPLPVPLHVTVLAPLGDSAAQARGAALVDTLRSFGYSVSDLQSTLARTSFLELHYFFAEDAAAMAELEKAAGAVNRSARLTQIPASGLPRPGAVEIFVPTDTQAGRHNRRT